MTTKIKRHTIPSAKAKTNIALPAPYGCKTKITGFQRKDHWVIVIRLKDGKKMILANPGRFEHKAEIIQQIWVALFTGLMNEYVI